MKRVSPRTWAALTALAVVATGLIAIAGQIDIPGVSKIIRPVETGIGTKCAQGNADACRQLCHAIAEVSSLTCGAPVIHRIHRRGGGGSTGSHPPGSQPGSGPSPAPPSSPPKPPEPPPTTTTTTPEPPPPPPVVPPIVKLLCRLDLLGHRVCIEVR